MTFTATVTNEGTGTAAASVLTLAVGGESTPQSFNISSLAPGASQTVTRTETLDVAQAYMNTATADANGDVAESDETNNVTTDTFTVTGASPDLVVTSLTHSPENPTTEDAMTFTAIVTNEGTGTGGCVRTDPRRRRREHAPRASTYPHSHPVHLKPSPGPRHSTLPRRT